jgi:hypothetical protein
MVLLIEPFSSAWHSWQWVHVYGIPNLQHLTYSSSSAGEQDTLSHTDSEESRIWLLWSENKHILVSNSVVHINWFCGVVGYHFCLTHRRSWVRASAESLFLSFVLSHLSRVGCRCFVVGCVCLTFWEVLTDFPDYRDAHSGYLFMLRPRMAMWMWMRRKTGGWRLHLLPRNRMFLRLEASNASFSAV